MQPVESEPTIGCALGNDACCQQIIVVGDDARHRSTSFQPLSRKLLTRNTANALPGRKIVRHSPVRCSTEFRENVSDQKNAGDHERTHKSKLHKRVVHRWLQGQGVIRERRYCDHAERQADGDELGGTPERCNPQADHAR